MTDSKWIRFDEFAAPHGHVTRRWTVRTREDGYELGVVKWFGRWRCYAFFPDSETAYEQQCLRVIAAFCEAKTRAHREARRPRPPNHVDLAELRRVGAEMAAEDRKLHR